MKAVIPSIMSIYQPGKALLSAQQVTHSYGAQPVLKEISLTIHEGDRIGLIGRNGSGKSTLMKILAAQISPDHGFVTNAQGLSVALLSQECRLDREQSIGAVLKTASSDRRALLQAYRETMDRLAATPGDCWEHQELQEECDRLQHAVEAAGVWELDQDIKRISVSLALPEPDRILASLSGGELRRVDLATKLIQHPQVLMLDEPTNHIDTRSVEWIERFLEHYEGSCILVTHDRYFLDRVVNRIVELEFNRIYSFPGAYERFLEYKTQVEESQARSEANRLSFIRRELGWLKRGPKARTGKQKARIQRAETMMDQGPPPKHREFLFQIPEPGPLSKTILEARELSHGYGETRLFQGFSMIFQKQMRVGILGPNGSGKTTLLRVLMGREEARRGRLIIGDNTAFLYVDQNHEAMQPDQSVLQFVSNGAQHIEINKRRVYVPAYLEKFLFDKDAVHMPVGNLSGGERNRLDLLKKLLKGGNFLVLDEPTNDLDLYSLRILEETIESFNGPALIVSHDRYFLNRICTHMLIFEEDGSIVQITGNYDDYLVYAAKREADRREALAEAPKKERRTTAPAQRRLTWKEQKELDGMEERILEMESGVEELEARIQAPGFYEQGHKAVQETLDALAAAKAQVSALYERWEELEALR